MKRDYARLPIEQFGRHLITTGDLDPVYVALNKLDWPQDQVHRWLVAYWCFYHCGFASYASERTGIKYWYAMRTAAANEDGNPCPAGGRWPRGHERRHARGDQGWNMVVDLEERYGNHPEGMVHHILGGTRKTQNLQFEDVAKRVKEHTLFGPWIAFKVCDMVDRVLGVPISFKEAHVFMFKDPVKAALMLWRNKHGLPENARPKDAANQALVIKQVVEYLEDEFHDLLAPPLGDRPVGLQEIETVLCCWKSHMNGHYPLYNDIDEINDGLQDWIGVSDNARAFAQAMPTRGGSTNLHLDTGAA